MKTKVSIFFVLLSILVANSSFSMKRLPGIQKASSQEHVTLISSDGEKVISEESIAEQFETIKKVIEDAGSQEAIPLPSVSGVSLGLVFDLAKVLYPLHIKNERLPANEKIFMPRAFQPLANRLLKEFSNEQLIDAMMAANYLDNKMILNAVVAVIADKLSSDVKTYKLQLVIELLQNKKQKVDKKLKKLIEQKKMNSILQLPAELQNRIAWYLTLRKDGVMQEYSIADGIAVKAHSQPRVENNQLDLARKKLTSLFGLQRIQGLVALQELNLRANNLSSIDPGTFNGLTALKKLNLSDNKLSSIHPDTFNGLVALQELYLSNNLRSIAPGTFQGLVALQTLKLDFNKLSSIHPDTFKGLAGLQKLYLNGNNLKSITPGTFQGLVALQTLKLDFNNLSSIHPDTFKGLAALRELDLSGNNLKSIGPDTFKRLVGLQRLDLGGNSSSSIHPDTFKGLVGLQRLNLDFNKLSSIAPDIFKGLVGLQWLSLSGNNLSSIDPGTFNGLTGLQWLDLKNNKLTEQKEEIKKEVRKVAPDAEIKF